MSASLVGSEMCIRDSLLHYLGVRNTRLLVRLERSRPKARRSADSRPAQLSAAAVLGCYFQLGTYIGKRAFHQAARALRYTGGMDSGGALEVPSQDEPPPDGALQAPWQAPATVVALAPATTVARERHGTVPRPLHLLLRSHPG
eukprot:3001057-Alexandrium_andersonii.AAC.1